MRSSILTRRFASIDFGGATTFDQTGGLIGATSIAGANALTYQLDKAAQFHLGGHAAAQGPLIDVVNGLFYNQGNVTQGVSVSGANFARLILATTGGAFTLAAGQSLTLTGGDVLCGFDGTDGGAASITLVGTVTMNAASGAMPQLREFRSGISGETPTSVASSVTCGGTLNVDITGVAAGTYDLILVDTVSGTFDTVNITGGNGSVSYTATAVRIAVL